MAGQFNPVPGDPTIRWRIAVQEDGEQYLAVVEEVRGTTRNDGRLTIFNNGTPIHRSAVEIKQSALFGVNPLNEADWEAEIVRVIRFPETRMIRMD